MKKQNLVFVMIVTVVTVLDLSCKDTGTNPNQTIKTPREMTWTADTLPVPEGAIQVLPEDLLVLSPTDIYLAIWVGHGQIMHYDGKSWKMVKEIGGGIDCFIQGNSNDIWAGGYIGHQNGSQFMRSIYLGNYNGISWYDNELSMQSEILDLTKDPDGNIWACGRNGVVLKYTQGRWISDIIKISFAYPAEYFLKSIESYNNKIYILASSMNTNTLVEKYFYITGDMKNWTIADSMTLDSPSSIIKWGYRGIYSYNFNKLYSYGLGGIWQYNDGLWNKLLETDGAINGITYTDENYLLAVGDFQKILFYNGSTWTNVNDLFHVKDPYFVFKNVWTNGYESFMVGYTFQGNPQKTIIFHGK